MLYETNCDLWIWAIQIKFDWIGQNDPLHVPIPVPTHSLRATHPVRSEFVNMKQPISDFIVVKYRFSLVTAAQWSEQKLLVVLLYTQHLLHLCLSWERDPSHVALSEVFTFFLPLWRVIRLIAINCKVPICHENELNPQKNISTAFQPCPKRTGWHHVSDSRREGQLLWRRLQGAQESPASARAIS